MVSGLCRRAPRPCLGFGLAALIGSLLACSDHAPNGTPIATLGERVESTGFGVFYRLASAPAPSFAQLSAAEPAASEAERLATFARELAAQAGPYWSSGAMTIPALTAAGGQRLYAPAPAGNLIRYSCGVTFVSPSYAVTAGHCVTDDGDLSALKVRLYRPTRRLAENYVPAVLSGSYPSYTQPRLGPSDGYLFDEYACTVVNRCYHFENDIECPSGFDNDFALLHCSGRPGDKYGFLNVNAAGSPAGKEALLHWKHEVLDLGAPESALPADRIDHYVRRTADVSQNYHYFDDAADLLPLRSITWSEGIPTSWVGSTAADTHGCHGTSGSGMLVRVGETVQYDLVGPVVLGGQSLNVRLCEAVPNPGGPASGRGTVALLTDGTDPNAVLALRAQEIAADCQSRAAAERDLSNLPFSAGSHAVATIFTHLACQIDDYGANGTVTPAPVFGPYPEKFVEAGAPASLEGFALEAGADYRFGVQVMPGAACASDCGSLTLVAGTAAFELVPDAVEPSVVAVTFAATSTGPIALSVTNAGQLRAFGGVVLIREGQVNSFDTLEDRLEAALYALDADGTVFGGPLPMRFGGDGEAGFLALLMPGERMALLRQALPPGRNWTVRLGATSYDELSCGLLDERGAPLGRQPCSAVLRLDDRAGTEARLGFYIELPDGSARESAELRYVALASDAARDDDSDGVPEVVDNCPNDWNAAQAECSEEPPPDETGNGGAGGESPSGEGGLGGETVTPSAGGAGGAEESAGGEGGDAGEPSAEPSGGAGENSGSAGTDPVGNAGAPAAGGSGASGGTEAAAGTEASAGSSASGAAGSASESSASKPGPEDDSSCACRAGARTNGSSAGWLALGLAAATLRRRRGKWRTPVSCALRAE